MPVNQARPLPVVTQPFNLGNVLAQTAGIQNLRSTNKLREAQLKELERQGTQREALTNTLAGLDLSDPNAVNELARSGFLGAAGQVTNLQSSLAQLEGEQLDNALDLTRLYNNAARSIQSSADPIQAAVLALKNPILREKFAHIDPTTMTVDELLKRVANLRQETDFINDPAAIAEIVSGPEVVSLGFQPGTVLQRTTQPSGQEDIKVVQAPPPAIDPFKAEDRITKEVEQNLKTEAGLRSEFNTLIKDFRLVADSFARVKASASDPSAAGDLSLIFNFMKMLDPNSVVRESEFATAANAASVPRRIRAQYNKVVSGERMAAGQRADFVNRSNVLFDASKNEAQKTADAYIAIATDAGVNAQNVIAVFTARQGAESFTETAAGVPVAQPPGFQPSQQVAEGTVGINPQTGQEIVLQNGQWVDVNTGAPL